MPRFHFEFEPAMRMAATFVGVTPGSAWVDVNEGMFTARFGPWRVRTPTSNIVSAQITGPYAFGKVVGGPRLSLVDSGLTFATSTARGVCVCFRQPVPGLDPLGVLRHECLTVTVSDPERLVELLGSPTG